MQAKGFSILPEVIERLSCGSFDGVRTQNEQRGAGDGMQEAQEDGVGVKVSACLGHSNSCAGRDVH